VTLYRNVNGKDVPLTAGEEAEHLAEGLHYKRVARRDEVLHLLKEKLDAGVVFDGERFKDYDRLALQVALVNRDMAGTFRVITGGGTVVEMSAHKLLELAMALIEYNVAAVVIAQDILAALDKTDKPEAIDITSGWPSEFVSVKER
jgi:hypothetical protein